MGILASRRSATALLLGAIAVLTAASTWVIIELSRRAGSDAFVLGSGSVTWVYSAGAAGAAVARWTVTVLVSCALLWVATVRQAELHRPWLPVGVGAAIVLSWTATAFVVSPWSWTPPLWFVHAFLDNGGWFDWPWLGPLAGFGQGGGVSPGLAVPVVFLATLGITAVLARRHAARRPVARRPTTGQSRALALLIVGVPAVTLWIVSATVLLADPDGRLDAQAGGMLAVPWAQQTFTRPAAVLATALVLAAAFAISGAGRASLVLVPAQAWAAWPLVTMWWGGGPSGFALAAVLTSVATALIAVHTPLARHLTWLSAPETEAWRPPVTGQTQLSASP